MLVIGVDKLNGKRCPLFLGPDSEVDKNHQVEVEIQVL
jgi:hypothetical protein